MAISALQELQPVKAGILRHSVTVQSFTKATGGLGQVIETWADIAVRRAQVTPLKGRESNDKVGEYTIQYFKIVMRYEANLITTDRQIIWEGLTLDIDAPVNVAGRNVMMEVYASVTTRN